MGGDSERVLILPKGRSISKASTGFSLRGIFLLNAECFFVLQKRRMDSLFGLCINNDGSFKMSIENFRGFEKN